MVAIRTSQALGSEVRRLRLDLGMSQTDLASRAGLSRSFISELEGGKPTIEFGRVLRVLGALKVALHLIGTPEPSGTKRPDNQVDLDDFLHELGTTDG